MYEFIKISYGEIYNAKMFALYDDKIAKKGEVFDLVCGDNLEGIVLEIEDKAHIFRYDDIVCVTKDGLNTINEKEWYETYRDKRVPLYCNYYYVNDKGLVSYAKERGSKIDNKMWECGNYFSNELDAYSKALNHATPTALKQTNIKFINKNNWGKEWERAKIIVWENEEYKIKNNINKDYIVGTMYFPDVINALEYINTYLIDKK